MRARGWGREQRSNGMPELCRIRHHRGSPGADVGNVHARLRMVEQAGYWIEVESGDRVSDFLIRRCDVD